EVLDIILGLWTQDSFTYKGQFYSYPVPGWKETNPLVHDSRYHGEDGELIALGLTPKPYQKPHPPVWMMAESVASHEYSAKRGINAMCFSGSLGRIKEAWTAYNNVASEVQGRDIPFGEGLAVMRPAYVAETYEEAVSTIRDGANLLGSWLAANPHKARRAMTLDGELSEEDMDLEWFDFQLKHDMILVGSPESVSEQIEGLQKEINCQHLALFLNFPGLPLEKVLNCLNLFGEKVMPRFQ
ncbi:MAG: LLM class flavin-dependent oxidoreductase, partial [Dehalococcoidia bacterium]